MYAIVQQTHEEKVKMYQKCKKKKLIEMLIACNDIIDTIPKVITIENSIDIPDGADFSVTEFGAHPFTLTTTL